MHKYNKSDIQNWLFFDIEVVREFDSFNTFKDNKNPDFWKKANNKYYLDHIAEFGDTDVDEVCYSKNAAFFPEYGKVISISFGRFKVDLNGDDIVYEKQVMDFSLDDEKELLIKTADLLTRNFTPNTHLCGFNVIEFDIPYLIKRMIKHGLKVPQMLKNCVAAKPWDVKVVDVMKDWKFNGTKNTSLGTLEELLGVESSKDGEVNGMNLGNKYWEAEDKTAFVKKVGLYARHDVSSLMDIVLKICDS